tara:strand:- start:122 stop:346 length:225 start_codon:yes stop_codon:yes gene_type:complete
MQTEEQLLRNKITHLEDKINTLEKSIGKINIILGRFQMTEGKEQDPFLRVMEQGERDDSYNITGKKTESDHELI